MAERYGRDYVKHTQYKAKAKQAQEALRDPADRGPHPRGGRRPRPVPAPALRADLEAGRGLSDGPGPVRPDQRRHQAGELTFRATGSVLRFDLGFVRVYLEGRDDDVEEEAGTLPELAVGQVLRLVELTPEQHFTEPPPTL